MINPKFVEQVKDAIDDVGQKLNQSNEAHVANYTAIVFLLVEKGLITQEEYDAVRIVMTHTAEQEWARKRDELEHENENKEPNQ